MTETIWTDNIFFGFIPGNGKIRQRIFLRPPSWDCDWYWGFGYLGNKNCHYHLRDYQNSPSSWGHRRNINIHDALLADYTDMNPKIKNDLWNFCELVMTAYALKETAEVLGRGGSHYTKNPLMDIIKNEAEVKRINEVVLPAIFDEMWRRYGNTTSAG